MSTRDIVRNYWSVDRMTIQFIKEEVDISSLFLTIRTPIRSRETKYAGAIGILIAGVDRMDAVDVVCRLGDGDEISIIMNTAASAKEEERRRWG